MRKLIGYFLLVVPTTAYVLWAAYSIEGASAMGFVWTIAKTLPIVIPYAICTACMVVGLRLVKASSVKS